MQRGRRCEASMPGSPDEEDIAPDAVVVGTDGSPSSDGAVRFGVEQAALRHTELVVAVAFMLPIDPDLDSFDTPPEVLRATACADVLAGIHRALSLGAEEQVPCRVIAHPGPAVRVLAGVGREASMVVVGPSRHHFAWLGLGEDTLRGLTHWDKVPVVIVPADYVPHHVIGGTARR